MTEGEKHARKKALKLESDRRCRNRVRRYGREWARRNSEKNKQTIKAYRWRIRLETIAAYGGACKCCGEDTPQFLTIDHVFNDGAEHREGRYDRTGTKFYLWLRRQGWPQDRYQCLCYNCNCAKGNFGVCPHQTARLEAGA